jgi:hypothetical protein
MKTKCRYKSCRRTLKGTLLSSGTSLTSDPPTYFDTNKYAIKQEILKSHSASSCEAFPHINVASS